MRNDAKVLVALELLEPRMTEKWPIEQFKEALDDDNGDARCQLANASLNGIKLAVNR
jgi:hypothetical protein